jgi:hypothetical protein
MSARRITQGTCLVGEDHKESTLSSPGWRWAASFLFGLKDSMDGRGDSERLKKD